MSKKEEVDFFSTNEVEVQITMKNQATMIFPLAEILDEEAKLLRQKHLALSKEAQEKAQHDYNCKLLERQLTRPVVNPIPGFPDYSKDADFKSKTAAFFADAKEGTVPGEKKRDLLTNVFGLFWRSVQPEEFFR